MLSRAIPAVLAGPLAGILLDRFDRRRAAEGHADRLGVPVSHRDAIAVRGERELGIDEALSVPAAEELLRFLRHLLFLFGDEGDDVVERIERGDPRVARPRERLHGRDDRALDPELLLQRGGGEHEPDRRAVAVGHDGSRPPARASLSVEGVHVFGIDLGDHERNVGVHAVRLHVREDVVPGHRERRFPFRRRLGRQRREADLCVDIGTRCLEGHSSDGRGHVLAPVPRGHVTVPLPRLRVARRERADLEPRMALQETDEALPHRSGGAEDRDLAFAHRGQV